MMHPALPLHKRVATAEDIWEDGEEKEVDKGEEKEVDKEEEEDMKEKGFDEGG